MLFHRQGLLWLGSAVRYTDTTFLARYLILRACIQLWGTDGCAKLVYDIKIRQECKG